MKLIKDVLKKQIVEDKLVTPGIGEVVHVYKQYNNVYKHVR